MEVKNVKVKEWDIYYIKFGNGPNHLMYLGGGFGGALTLKSVFESFDPDKFTVIAWDPPGYGMSRHSSRVFTDCYFEEEAEYASDFMKALDISRYSVVGYCAGGRVAMILAAQHPDQVESLTLANASSFVFPSEMEKQIITVLDLQKWAPKLKENLMQAYNYTEKNLNVAINFFSAMLDLIKKRKFDICNNILHLIKCKTLILSGAKDPIVDNRHATYLSSKIKHSSVYVYPEGGHFLMHCEDFIDRITRFILE